MPHHVLPHVLATLAAVIGLGYVLGRLCRRMGQPAVIGEILAGIALGPTFLGMISPEAMHLLLPAAADDSQGHVRSALKVVAQLGVILYMFLVGLELNGAKLKHQAGATFGITVASIAAPFAIGIALAFLLHPVLSDGAPFPSFALFLGAAMSVTAFPVLARILEGLGLEKSEVGVLALGCAAADDVLAWCLLAFVVGVAGSNLNEATATLLGAAAFILMMFVAIRPVMARVALLHPPVAMPLVFVGVLAAAVTTDLIGIHAVFGAFLFGVVIPHDSPLAREFIRKLKDVVTALLLPAFFALAGMRTDLHLIADPGNVLITAGIIAVATVGKFGGAFVASRLSGRDTRTAAALGAMMNTRGLMGLIVLDIGLNLGVISPTLYAMMVVMALVTTLATTPILKRLIPEDSRIDDGTRENSKQELGVPVG